ncbi:MAG: type 4a pilus biogenesis protein PilO [Candidatus Omnitrophica bacterium]|nr:type 4a pilus biogenesis protein PilO [Candidatus Omnitrophota bacterium]
MVKIPRDKKILVIAAVCVIIVLIFWAFVYFPARKKLGVLKSEYGALRKEVAEIESRGGSERDIMKMVVSLRNDLDAATLRLPAKEETTLKMISSEASRLGVEVISLSPRPKRPFQGPDGGIVPIENKRCFEIPISMEVRGSYKAIGEYLSVLRQTPNALIKTEDILLRGDDAAGGRLRGSVELAIYILRKE